MPGSPAHLVARFFDVLLSRPLDDAERVAVDIWLSPALAELFFDQSPADQRHGYEAALTVIGSGDSDHDLVVAALLHDIGKRHARLGIVGRSLASVLILMHLPLTERMRAYRDHGVIGARELGAARAPSVAIDFALHHHRERPQTIDEAAWELLTSADQPQRRR